MAGGGQDRAPALGWGEGFHPNRPKTVARNYTIPHKVTKVSRSATSGTHAVYRRRVGPQSHRGQSPRRGIRGTPNYGPSGPDLAVGGCSASTRERPPRPPLRRPTRRGPRRFRRLRLVGPYGTRAAVGWTGALRRRPHPIL